MIVALCGAIGLVTVLLVMTMVEQQISTWSTPLLADRDEAPPVASDPGRRIERGAEVRRGAHCSGPAEWITADDYPADAIRNDYEGTTRISWSVGDDGRVASCRVIESSGHELLDRAGCQAIVARGCYDPAKLPIDRTFTRRIVWRLPTD